MIFAYLTKQLIADKLLYYSTWTIYISNKCSQIIIRQKHIKESYTSNEDNQLYLFFFLILPLTLCDYGFYIW